MMPTQIVFEDAASHAEKFQAYGNCEITSFTSGWHVVHYSCAAGHKMYLEGIVLMRSNTLAIQYLR